MEQTEPGSNSDLPSSSSSSSVPVLFRSSSSSVLSPLADPHPKHTAAGLSCHCSPIPTAPFPGFVFVWLVVDLPLAPAWGSPFPLARLLNQTVCSLKWPITQIGDYKAAACLQSVQQHEHDDQMKETAYTYAEAQIGNSDQPSPETGGSTSLLFVLKAGEMNGDFALSQGREEGFL